MKPLLLLGAMLALAASTSCGGDDSGQDFVIFNAARSLVDNSFNDLDDSDGDGIPEAAPGVNIQAVGAVTPDYNCASTNNTNATSVSITWQVSAGSVSDDETPRVITNEHDSLCDFVNTDRASWDLPAGNGVHTITATIQVRYPGNRVETDTITGRVETL